MAIYKATTHDPNVETTEETKTPANTEETKTPETKTPKK